MDPEANLDEQLLIARKLLDSNAMDLDTEDGLRLCELVIALNEWIRGGGFLPPQWKQ